MKLVLLIVFIVGFFFALPEKNLAQCDCAPKLTLQEHFQRSQAVFVGKVIRVDRIAPNSGISFTEVEFEVNQLWKGDLGKSVTVKDREASTVGFEPGTEWLLYASADTDGVLWISRGCCSRTKPMSVASKTGDLTGFKKMGEKLKNIKNR